MSDLRVRLVYLPGQFSNLMAPSEPFGIVLYWLLTIVFVVLLSRSVLPIGGTHTAVNHYRGSAFNCVGIYRLFVYIPVYLAVP